MLKKKLQDAIVKLKLKEVTQIKKKFEIGLIRNAVFSVGTDFNSAQVTLNNSKTIPVIVPLQRKYLTGNGEIENYEPFKITRSLSKMNLAVFLVASDREFMGGDPAHIKLVKTGAEISVIQHDFFIDEVQIYQAKSYGSDGILLDSEFLDSKKLGLFSEVAFQLGMEPFIKIDSTTELENIDHEIIGGVVIEKEGISGVLKSEFYRRMKEAKPSPLPVIVRTPWLSPREIDYFRDQGIHHFLLNDDWLWQPDALKVLERMIQNNWPDRQL